MKKDRFLNTLSSFSLVLVLSAVMLLAAASSTVLASAASETGSDISITYPFLDTAKVAYEWTFPYSDDYFRSDPAVFSRDFAKGSLGLAASAFRSTENTVDPQYETYLSGAGFTDLYAFGYDEETTTDSLSGIIGMKQVDDFTVIAAVTCGQGYGNEWAGNLKVGAGDVHEGFSEGSALLGEHLSRDITDNNISGPKKLWLTGISRAAAIANLAAADAIESKDYEAVYAYLFGVPRTTKNPVAYKGIYNICGQFDPVANVPFQSWGFERHGTDLYTPAQESNDEYLRLKTAASEVSEAMADDHFRNNPEINYQLHLLLEFMARFFPSNQEYAERFQDILMKTWKDSSMDNITGVMSASVRQMDDLDAEEEHASSVFLDYLSYAIGKHTRADVYGIDDGNWNPKEGLDANVVIEHRPSTYVKWLFTDAENSLLYSSDTGYRRLIITGDVDIELYDDGKCAKKINRDRTIATIDETRSDLFAVRNADSTMICLPADDDYMLRIKSYEDTDISCYDTHLDSDHLQPYDSARLSGSITAGEYELVISHDEPAGSITDIRGHSRIQRLENFRPTAVTMMSGELAGVSSEFMTLSGIAAFVYEMELLMILMGIVWLIVELVNLYWRKAFGDDAHTPAGFIIALHLVVISINVWLTELLTFYLFSVSRARTMAACFVLIAILLLSLRGVIRTFSFRSLIYLIIPAAMIPLCSRYYSTIPIFNEFTIPHVIFFAATVMILTGISLYLFWLSAETKARIRSILHKKKEQNNSSPG